MRASGCSSSMHAPGKSAIRKGGGKPTSVATDIEAEHSFRPASSRQANSRKSRRLPAAFAPTLPVGIAFASIRFRIGRFAFLCQVVNDYLRRGPYVKVARRAQHHCRELSGTFVETQQTRISKGTVERFHCFSRCPNHLRVSCLCRQSCSVESP